MALNLTRKFSQLVTNRESFLIPVTFKSEYLVILARCVKCRDTWHKAGYLSQHINTLPLKKVQVKSRKLILLNSPVIESFPLFQLGYQLRFDFVDWIEKLVLEVYEPTNLE